MKQTNGINVKGNSLIQWSQRIMVLMLAVFILAACSKEDKKLTTPRGPYENGFFILNEGWFGKEAGSINFYAYGADTIQQKVFAKENNGNAPTLPSATLEDGLIIGDRLFVISAKGGPITVIDPATLKQTGQIQLEGSDFRSMAAIDKKTAVVSSGSKIYTVDLQNLSISAAPVFTGNNIKKLYVSGDVLVASDNKGVALIAISDWTLLSHFDGPTEGYVKTPDGQLYGGGGNLLVAIDAAKQDTFQVPLTQPVWVNDYTYNAPSLVSSSKENAVFYLAKPTSGYGANSIYKFKKEDPASTSSPFITLPAGETFYSTGLSYDKKNDQLVTWSISGYTESDSNFLRFYNAATGQLVKTIEYGHVYFPANIVFYN